jgi:geranylgeranyl pyrophosphate synthase
MQMMDKIRGGRRDMSSFLKTLEPWRTLFEERLEALQAELYPGDDQSLHPACRYALAGQGKRIRPLLTMAAAVAAGGTVQASLPFAAAVEMIHTYSLIHDDLPCMDDDEMRRGRATTHVIYDEATAMLAGDALLTDAFQVICLADHLAADARLKAVKRLSRAAGGVGMVKGQALDMHWTGRSDFTRLDLDSIHIHKTGALIAAAAVLGGISAGADDEGLDRLERFGTHIGLAFQIIDDALDETEGIGKSLGKDLDLGKLTYLRLLSRDDALRHAKALTDIALEQLEVFGERAAQLRAIGLSLLERKN